MSKGGGKGQAYTEAGLSAVYGVPTADMQWHSPEHFFSGVVSDATEFFDLTADDSEPPGLRDDDGEEIPEEVVA